MRKLLGYGILVLLALIFYTIMGLCVGFLFATILYVSVAVFVGLVLWATELITES